MTMSYPGLNPSNVGKDAKYSVVSGSGGRMEVRLIYRISSQERVLLTTDRHDALVEMVNDVKLEVSGVPGGVFYINEYRDVLVPVGGDCLYAGNYPTYDLVFDFDGTVIGPHAPAGLKPGDLWPGPHVGIRYVLTAESSDMKFAKVTGNREFTELLSKHSDAASARRLAQRLGKHKGTGGGRVYINEASEFFSPIEQGGEIEYVYLGSLDEDIWFDAPDVPRPGD